MSDFIITKEQKLFTSTIVDNAFIADYMPSAPGNAVKVYLYGLMLNANPNEAITDFVAALGMTEESILDAFRFWEKQGLIRIIDSGNFTIQYLNVSKAITSGIINSDACGRYNELIKKLQEILGTRNLVSSELQKIFDWIEIFGFEDIAAIEIVRHCIEIKGARVHINYMDSIAKRLASEKLVTFESVQENFIREKEMYTGAASILKRWRLNRHPTEDELDLYRKWTKGWGFSDEAIELACKDVVAIDKPNFKYLDAILGKYRETGSITQEKMKEIIREQDTIAELTRKVLARAGLKRTASSSDRQQMELWLKDWCMNPELIFYAAEISAKKAKPFAEIKLLLSDWYEKGIDSLPAARSEYERDAKKGYKKPAKTINRALNYKQTNYTAEQLRELGVDFGDDVYED